MTNSFNTKILFQLLVSVASLSLLAFAYSVFAQEAAEDSVPVSDQVLYEVSPTGAPAPVPGETVRRMPADNINRAEDRQELIEQKKVDVADKIEERKIQMEDRVEEGKIKLEERREAFVERKTALQEVRQTRIINLAANISNRMDSAIARLFTIIERLEQRIVKLKEAGYATAPAEEKIREAARNLAEARGLMVNIDAYVTIATASNEPRGNWQDVRERYLSVGKLIRLAHQNLRDGVALLKEAVQGERQTNSENTETASTTTPTLTEL